MALALKSPPAGNGARWIGDAWRLFGRKPLAFSGLFALFLLVAVLGGLLPLVGPVLQMSMVPLMGLGFMVAGQAALLGDPVHPRHFIEPLRGDAQRRRSLIVLCLLYGTLALGILLVMDLVSDGAIRRMQQALEQGQAAQGQLEAIANEPGTSTATLLGLSLGALLSVVFWHAPALVHWGGQGVAQALFSSTLGVWRAKGAFFVYGMGWVGLSLVLILLSGLLLGVTGQAALSGPVMLTGLLILSTVFYVSLLFTFNDSFGNATTVNRQPDDPPPTTDMPL
jgi:hypothetical protein